MEKKNPLGEVQQAVDAMLNLGEERLKDAVASLLSSQKVQGAAKSVLLGGVDARKQLDKGVASFVSNLNMVTSEDVEKIHDKVASLENIVAQLKKQIDDMSRTKQEGKQEASSKKKAAPAKKKK